MTRRGRYEPTVERVLELSGVETLHPGGMAMTRRVAAVASIFQGDRVLVLASGHGRQAIFYAQESGAQITGVDPSPERVHLATLNAARAGVASRVRFRTADFRRLPFRDETFEAVIGERAVSISRDPQGVVGEMFRVLKRRGTLVVHEPTWRAPGPAADREELAGRYGATPLDATAWMALLERAGAAEVQTEGERWSSPDTFCSLRVEGAVPQRHAVLTRRERFRTAVSVAREFGLAGVRRALENERVLRRAVHDGKLGYGLYWGRRPCAR
jgi:SAM-dependent methyltransferase